MPERVIHGDTKINNLLFDAGTGEGLCAVDLDTVMPGLSLYDYGGLVRTSVDPAAERVNGPVLEALAEGYLAEMGGELTGVERELLPMAGPVHTFEDGIRFLTDHLAGDVYFRVDRPGRNLARARTQFDRLRRLESPGQGS
jgi:hypothetical protein